MGFFLLYGQAQFSSRRVKVIAWCAASWLFQSIRPVEAAFFQSTVVKPKAIGLPVQDLESVAPPVAEDKQAF